MRKILSIFLVMVLCVMLFGCNTDFSNCTSINIRCGTIKVPENWDVSYAENLMYFYSDNANDKKNIYIFQSNCRFSHKLKKLFALNEKIELIIFAYCCRNVSYK